MASSSLKKISKFSDDSIKLAINVTFRDDIEKNIFQNCLKKLEEVLTSEAAKIEKTGTKKRKVLPSAQIIFERNIIPKIREQLSEFERLEAAGETIDWQIDISYAKENFSLKSLDELKHLHTQICQSELMHRNIGLLLSYEKGRLYLSIRSRIPIEEELTKWCREELGVCYQQVARFVQFKLLVDRYPRLLVTQISFAQFVKHHTRLVKFFEKNVELSDRLANFVNITALQTNIDVAAVDTVEIPKKNLCFDPDVEFENYYDDGTILNENDNDDKSMSFNDFQQLFRGHDNLFSEVGDETPSVVSDYSSGKTPSVVSDYSSGKTPSVVSDSSSGKTPSVVSDSSVRSSSGDAKSDGKASSIVSEISSIIDDIDSALSLLSC